MHPMLTVLLQNATDTVTPATTPGTAAPAPGFDFTFGLMMVTMIGIFYFIVIRPQRKEQKRRMDMLSQIKKGDKVLTHAGIIGTLVSIKDNEVTVEVDENVRIRFSRAAIAQVMNAEEKEKVAVGK